MNSQSRQFEIHGAKGGSALAVRIILHSSKNEITEIQQDGTVKILLKSASNDTRLNEKLIKFLARILKTKVNQLEIVAGINDQLKLITIYGVDPDLLQEFIQKKVRSAIKKGN